MIKKSNKYQKRERFKCEVIPSFKITKEVIGNKTTFITELFLRGNNRRKPRNKKKFWEYVDSFGQKHVGSFSEILRLHLVELR
jgi:hypothetical protein